MVFGKSALVGAGGNTGQGSMFTASDFFASDGPDKLKSPGRWVIYSKDGQEVVCKHRWHEHEN